MARSVRLAERTRTAPILKGVILLSDHASGFRLTPTTTRRLYEDTQPAIVRWATPVTSLIEGSTLDAANPVTSWSVTLTEDTDRDGRRYQLDHEILCNALCHVELFGDVLGVPPVTVAKVHNILEALDSAAAEAALATLDMVEQHMLVQMATIGKVKYL